MSDDAGQKAPWETVDEGSLGLLGDVDFAQAVHLLAGIFHDKAAKLRREAEGGCLHALIEYLRSDQPIARADRDHLADLLSGELGLPLGRGPLKGPEVRLRAYVVANVLNLEMQTNKPNREDAIADTIARMSTPERQFSKHDVKTWIKEKSLLIKELEISETDFDRLVQNRRLPEYCLEF